MRLCVSKRALLVAGKEKEGASVESVPMKEEEGASLKEMGASLKEMGASLKQEEGASLKEEGASLKKEEGASFTRPDLQGGRGHPSHGIRVTASDIRVAQSKNRLGDRDKPRS